MCPLRRLRPGIAPAVFDTGGIPAPRVQERAARSVPWVRGAGIESVESHHDPEGFQSADVCAIHCM